MLEKIKWLLGIGWVFVRYENGDEMGDVIAVYQHKKTGELRRLSF